MKRDESLRKSDLPYIADLPWGAHLCGFYETKEELIDVVIPYLQAGLENNEYCVWIIAEPLSFAEAAAALKDRIKDFAVYETQIEIVHYSDWYFEQGDFQTGRLIEKLAKKINKVLEEGYDGLRACGNTAWLIKRYWQDFMEYEARVEKELAASRIIALCPYQLSRYSTYEILDIVHTHQFAFMISSCDWKYSDYVVKLNRMNLLGKMASSFVHEIRNPLTAVKGFVQLLQNKKDLQNYHNCLSLMLEELDRANDIINEYLSLARDKKTKTERHNLNDLLACMLPLLQAEAVHESKNIILNTHPIEDIIIDPKELRQVILNLSRNSLDAMAAGGTLSICTRMNEQGDRVILEIRDTGHGIPQEIINKLGTGSKQSQKGF